MKRKHQHTKQRHSRAKKAWRLERGVMMVPFVSSIFLPIFFRPRSIGEQYNMHCQQSQRRHFLLGLYAFWVTDTSPCRKFWNFCLFSRWNILTDYNPPNILTTSQNQSKVKIRSVLVRIRSVFVRIDQYNWCELVCARLWTGVTNLSLSLSL